MSVSENLQRILDEYKGRFTDNWPVEKYKWEAVANFQKNWDEDALDFKQMFNEATNPKIVRNLLSHGHWLPRKGILSLIAVDAGATRQMFKDLFNEEVDLSQRVSGFRTAALELAEKVEDEADRMVDQDLRAISTYLWLRYPDHYYIYMYSVAKDIADQLGMDRPKQNGSPESMMYAFSLYDGICDAIREDQEIRVLLAENLADDNECWRDESFHTATVDACWCWSGYHMAEIREKEKKGKVEQAKVEGWIPTDYIPGLSVDDWSDLLEDRKIFTCASLQIMRRLKDIGGQATCKQLSEKYGAPAGFYISNTVSLAKRIYKAVNCPLNQRENGDTRWWAILFIGKKEDKDDENTFLWRLRPELADALKNFDWSAFPEAILNVKDDAVVTTGEGIRYWLYEPGSGAKYWDEYYGSGIMAIGWNELGDLSEFSSKKEINLKMQECYAPSHNYSNDAYATWQFVHSIGPGDVIFAKNGTGRIVGRGIVTSDYYYDVERTDGDRNTRTVKWTHKGDWETPVALQRKTLTDLTDHPESVRQLNALFEEDKPGSEEVPVVIYPPYSEDDFLKDVFLEREDYDTLVDLVYSKKNVILQGAPGVGKTYAAKRLAYSMMGQKDSSRVILVQFHQSYSYEDFIMGFRPTETGYELRSGAFYDFCKKAQEDSDNEYFCIIDEINRGNLSKIFGELFMLIEGDKRGESVQMLYSNEMFSVPSNLYIIGTMNTADRSLAMMDYALRRRFAFFRMQPAFGYTSIASSESVPASKRFSAYQEQVNSPKFDQLIGCVKSLNEAIAKDDSLGEGFYIGHSYFCNLTPGVKDSELRRIVKYELIPLLEEYWYDEPALLKEWSEKLEKSIQ